MSEDKSIWDKPVKLNIDDDGFMGPGQPTLPSNPEEEPRLFEYQPGINLISMPRAGFGLTSFAGLRNLADSCKEVRLNIELIKREIRSLKWKIAPAKKPQEGLEILIEAEADAVTAFLDQPDGVHDFDQWINQLVEEVLVTDAATIWPEMDRSGKLLSLDLIDGTTIRPILDFRGRIAAPPLPGYIQVIHGMATSWFSRDRLIYSPLNATVENPYGASPMEYMMLIINLAMRRDLFHMGYYTEGNIPEALVGAPSSWSYEQVKNWQTYWDALVTGNLKRQRKMHFMPMEAGRGSVPVYEFRRDDPNTTERDKWLMQVACWAFGNSPAEFGLTPGDGLGGKGFSSGMEAVQYRSMLGPLTQYIERRMNRIIANYMGKPHLQFVWEDMGPREDKLQQAQVDQIYLASGVYSTSWVQEREGVPVEHRPEQAPAPVSASAALDLLNMTGEGPNQGSPFRGQTYP